MVVVVAVVGDLQLPSEVCKRLIRENDAGKQLNTGYSFLREDGKLPEQGTQIFIETGKYNPPEFWLPIFPAYSSHSL